jgi:hypothetical protein
MDYTEEQITEIKKLVKTCRQLEGILKISRKDEQRRRVSKDLSKCKNRLDELCPEGVPDFDSSDFDGESAENITEKKYPTISKFPVKKASEHCEDPDVNLLATLMEVFENEYWPAMSEMNIKLDYSHSSERDNFYALLEESKRNLKILTETIEEYATATNAEFREQLFKMRNKQVRIYLYETIKVFRKLSKFLEKLVSDINGSGNIIMNKGESINFSKKYHTASLLQHYSIPSAIREIFKFVNETINILNLPELE